MAHFFYFPPPLPPPSTTTRRSSAPLLNSQPDPQPTESLLDTPIRSDSMSSASEGTPSPTATAAPAYIPSVRRNSALSAHRNPRIFNHTPGNVRTRSIPGVAGSAGVIFERDQQTPSDDDVIIVTVRLSNKFRKSSVDGAEELPSRPPARSFLRRLSTRMSATSSFDHSAEKEERYKAVKMPRGEYKRYFARDKEGNYAGTEPEREWDERDLLRDYAAYQDIPIHSILC